MEQSLHLRGFTMRRWPERLEAEFPFSIPVVKQLDELKFAAPVTFLVGENGSGKSSLLEALACAIGSVTVGSMGVNSDPGLEAVRELAKFMRLVWSKRTRRGFFLRAEDFFGYAKQLSRIKADLKQEYDAVDREYVGRSELAKDLAKMPYASEMNALERRYGEGLDSQSHGESFLLLFQQRFVPDGLFLLDEPEAPLSPVRQLAFLSMLKQMVDENGQFIIATHSPILMAFPGAQILLFGNGTIQTVDYDELEHVRLTRDFLINRDAYLRRL